MSISDTKPKIRKGILYFIGIIVTAIISSLYQGLYKTNWSIMTIIFIIVYVLYFLILVYTILGKKLIFENEKRNGYYLITCIIAPLIVSIIGQAGNIILFSSVAIESFSLLPIDIYLLSAIILSILIVLINFYKFKLLKSNQTDLTRNFESTGTDIVNKLTEVIKRNHGKNEFALASTCVPIKIVKNDSAENSYTFCIIDNKAYSTNSWMFPGGHVHIRNIRGHKNDVVNHDIKNEILLPYNVARNKAEIEAGLSELKPVKSYNPREKEVNNDGCDLVSPHFNYLFRINENANCRKTSDHRFHIDLTYIMTYDEIRDESDYNRVLIEIDAGEISKPSKIIHKLETSINDFIWNNRTNSRYNFYYPNKNTKRTTFKARRLFPPSIPEIIEDTINFCEQINM